MTAAKVFPILLISHHATEGSLGIVPRPAYEIPRKGKREASCP